MGLTKEILEKDYGYVTSPIILYADGSTVKYEICW